MAVLGKFRYVLPLRVIIWNSARIHKQHRIAEKDNTFRSLASYVKSS
jgi:hypothetical protein